MKRNSLLLALAGAFAMALLGSASKALAQCAAGTVGTQLSGNYAIKVLGAQVDFGTPGDPAPAPIAGIGVFNADGSCGITGGEFIYNDDGNFTGPGTDPGPLAGITAFTGSLSANIDPASSFYYFNSNNQGVLVLSDSASGNVFAFGIAMASGNAEFRGARINGTGPGIAAVPHANISSGPPSIPNSSPGDPVSIVGEKQAAVTDAQFQNPVAINFDGVSGGVNGAGPYGLGYIPVSGQVQVNAGFVDGGGNLFYNYNGGTIDGSPILGGRAFVCDFTETFLSTPSTVDGTENTEAVFNGDFGCVLSGMDNETSSVLWGSANQYAFVMTTGAYGAPYTGISIGQADKSTIAGLDHAVGSLLSIKSATPKTLTITNDTAEPLNITSIAGSGGAFTSGAVTIGGTCPNPGDVPSNNVLNGPGSCTVVLSDSGVSCDTINSSCTDGANDVASACTAAATPYPCCTSAGKGVTCGRAKPYACCTGVGTGTCGIGSQTGTLTIASDHALTPPGPFAVTCN